MCLMRFLTRFDAVISHTRESRDASILYMCTHSHQR